MKTKRYLGLGLSLGVAWMMLATGCEEINLFQWASGGKDENCASDAVCFVDAVQTLKAIPPRKDANNDGIDDNKEVRDKALEKAKTIGERIGDTQTQAYVLTLTASVKAGDLVEVLEKFSTQKDFTVKDVANICPAGTLADDEIDTLMAADDKPQYKTMGRLCLSSEAKEDVNDAQKLLDDLRTTVAAGASVDNTKTGESLDNAAAKDMCKEFKGDESCTGLTAEEVQQYLQTNL